MDNSEIMTYESLEDRSLPFLFTDDGRIIINSNHKNAELIASAFDLYIELDDEVLYHKADELLNEWAMLSNMTSEALYRFLQKYIGYEMERRKLLREKQMKSLSIVKSESFGSIQCDFYRKDNEIWMTREQIGTALEYYDPLVSIGKIHGRHKDRLDQFSTFTKMVKVEGNREVSRDTIIYNTRGIYEICRWSKQPKADAFFDWIYDILEGLRKGVLTISTPIPQPQPQRKLPDKRQLEAQAKLLNARTRQAKFLLTTAKEHKSLLSEDELKQIVLHATTLTHSIS